MPFYAHVVRLRHPDTWLGHTTFTWPALVLPGQSGLKNLVKKLLRFLCHPPFAAITVPPVLHVARVSDTPVKPRSSLDPTTHTFTGEELWHLQTPQTRSLWRDWSARVLRAQALWQPAALYNSRLHLPRLFPQCPSLLAREWAAAAHAHAQWHTVVFRCMVCAAPCLGDFPRSEDPPPHTLLLCGLDRCARLGVKHPPEAFARLTRRARLQGIQPPDLPQSRDPTVLREYATRCTWVPWEPPQGEALTPGAHDPTVRVPWAFVPQSVRDRLYPPDEVASLTLSLHALPPREPTHWCLCYPRTRATREVCRQALTTLAAEWSKRRWPVAIQGLRAQLRRWRDAAQRETPRFLMPAPLRAVDGLLGFRRVLHARLKALLPHRALTTDAAAAHCELIAFPTDGTLEVDVWVLVRCAWMKHPLACLRHWTVPRARDPRWQAAVIQGCLVHEWGDGPSHSVPLLVQWHPSSTPSRDRYVQTQHRPRLQWNSAWGQWRHLARPWSRGFQRIVALHPPRRQELHDSQMPQGRTLHTIVHSGSLWRPMVLQCPCCARPFHTLQLKHHPTPRSQSPPLFCDGPERCRFAGEISTHGHHLAPHIRWGPFAEVVEGPARQRAWPITTPEGEFRGHTHTHAEAVDVLSASWPFSALPSSVAGALKLTKKAITTVTQPLWVLPHRDPPMQPTDASFARTGFQPPTSPSPPPVWAWLRALLANGGVREFTPPPPPSSSHSPVTYLLDLFFDEEEKEEKQERGNLRWCKDLPVEFSPHLPTPAFDASRSLPRGLPFAFTPRARVLDPTGQVVKLVPRAVDEVDRLLTWAAGDLTLQKLPSISTPVEEKKEEEEQHPHPLREVFEDVVGTVVAPEAAQWWEDASPIGNRQPRYPPLAPRSLRDPEPRTPEEQHQLQCELLFPHEHEEAQAPDWWVLPDCCEGDRSAPHHPVWLPVAECGYTRVAWCGWVEPSPQHFPHCFTYAAILVGPARAGLVVCSDPCLGWPSQRSHPRTEHHGATGHWRLRHWEHPDTRAAALEHLQRLFRPSTDNPRHRAWDHFCAQHLVPSPVGPSFEDPEDFRSWVRSSSRAQAYREPHAAFVSHKPETWRHARWPLALMTAKERHHPLVTMDEHHPLFQGTAFHPELGAHHQTFGDFEEARQEAWRHPVRGIHGVVTAVLTRTPLRLYPLSPGALDVLFEHSSPSTADRVSPHHRLNTPFWPPLLAEVPCPFHPLQFFTGYHPRSGFRLLSPPAEFHSAAAQRVLEPLVTALHPENHGVVILPDRGVTLWDSVRRDTDRAHPHTLKRPPLEPLDEGPWQHTPTCWRPHPAQDYVPGAALPLLQHTAERVDEEFKDEAILNPATPAYPVRTPDPRDQALEQIYTSARHAEVATLPRFQHY